MKTRVVNLLKIASIPLACSSLGILFNTLVYRANGGMPTPTLYGPYDRWVPLTSQTRYAILGDVIPLLDSQLSLGDILIYLGFAIWICVAVLYFYRLIKLLIKDKEERRFRWY